MARRSSVIRKIVEGESEALERFAGEGGVAAESETEVMRHLEVESGDDSDFIFCAQELGERLNVTGEQAGREGRSVGRDGELEIGARREDFDGGGAVSIKGEAGTGFELINAAESDGGKLLGDVGSGGAEEVLHFLHTSGENGLGENPSAAERAEAVGFGETGGDDEIISERESVAGGGSPDGFAIDLIDEDAGTYFFSGFSDGAKGGGVNLGAGGIVQVAQGDNTGARGDGAADVIGIDGEIIFRAAGKAADGGTEKAGSVQQGVVGGLLDEHFVTGIEERAEGKVVGERGADGGDDGFGGDLGAEGEALHNERVAVRGAGAEFEVVGTDGKFAEGDVMDGAGAEVEADGE